MATWYDLTFNYKDVLTALNMTRLDGNLDALAEGSAGSPKIKTAAIDDDQVTVDKLAHSIDASGIAFKSADSDKVDTYHAGNAAGQVALSNGTVCTNLNADLLDGIEANVFATFHYSGAKVYDAAAPAAMTDLDLSGTIGSNRALVFLKIKDDAGVGDAYYFRVNGETDTVSTGEGLQKVVNDAANRFAYIWVLTDTSGIVEWYSDAQGDTEIYVLAYMKAG